MSDENRVHNNDGISFLWQHVTKPTHKRGNTTASTLDLVLTNDQDMIDEVKTLAPIEKSHHSALSFTFKCYKCTYTQGTSKTIPNLKRGDYDTLRIIVSNTEFNSKEDQRIQSKWEFFCKTLNHAIDQAIPKIKIDPSKPKPAEWIDRSILTKVRQKDKKYNKYMGTRSEEDYKSYCRIRNQSSQISRYRNLRRVIKIFFSLHTN
ncbi:hypothetical protein CAPTEDRAFT_186807 [Capitella teleta]|uniref:Endonuclease/exonuclease/phosphatase domain-containing protein n=1 Tax=Capitella teleta TaxID=283909 RepID=R7T328_CAPTE|nr:hypothetical protein CAPTEDRAFT_186807 [Capitella teleta]|eukprot:ELT87022.1 hypothetical protein CAPTEDRAFT_186807 [Capitella teleta]